MLLSAHRLLLFDEVGSHSPDVADPQRPPYGSAKSAMSATTLRHRPSRTTGGRFQGSANLYSYFSRSVLQIT